MPRSFTIGSDPNKPDFDLDAGAMEGSKYYAYGVSVRKTYPKKGDAQ
jgi:hypothetical protein